ncbi:MAG: NHL repeat-containing protein, partial [Anaerolineae bacterium]|nr:NHL repeat-containing protein [Anaerolineae bacterium]
MHQVWHLSPSGEILHTWGSYGTAPGQFNEPCDVAVDALGDVYVADTWNHRVQKFTAEGEFLLSWGRLAEVDGNDASGWGAFFGPRGVAIDSQGAVLDATGGGGGETTGTSVIYVADTGNDRIQAFDSEGQFLRVFGSSGDGLGQLDEPVGLAVGADGLVYVADTWHRRIQVFDPNGLPLQAWEMPVWANLRLDDRPHLAVTADAVLATDPVYQRILVYSTMGEPQQALRDLDSAPVLGGIDLTAEGVVVSDRMLSELVVYPFDDGDRDP